MGGAVVEKLKTGAKKVEQKVVQTASKHINKEEFGEYMANAGIAAIGTLVTGLTIYFLTNPFQGKAQANSGSQILAPVVGTLTAMAFIVGGYLVWKHYDGLIEYFALGLGIGGIFYIIGLILDLFSIGSIF